ncbi:unnamed protein product [Larinioides sclopetarius]|uniref:Uncharacterized protein n=1 Tax=Larinioides sclopetarius TaxID=280406 RepID=A0AAV2B0W0_9ARAC
MYLREASCLNAYSNKAFGHCVEKIIGIDYLNPDNTFELLSKHERTVIDCSGTALQEKCGYYAGNIFKKFLMFHGLTYYKYSKFKSEEIDTYTFSSALDYDITEAIFNVLKTEVFGQDFDNEATERANVIPTNFEETKLYYLENQISSDDSITEEAYANFDFNHPLTEEPLITTEYSFTDSLYPEAELHTIITEPDKLEFPALPKHHYIHKNKTTFALYEDLEMGHMKYIGCGEADFFWIILSPLRSKYCTLTDLISEYSDAIFKCTIRIDTPCSPELDDEDRNKRAEVFHRRYVATVLTLPNNQRSEDMAIMNVHYLKIYPSPSMHVPEKKVNLWKAEASIANIEQTKHVGRKGLSELEDNRDYVYQHNSSGQKWDKDAINSPAHLAEDEYFEEYKNWDYYPLKKEIYFPELLADNIIYIEDDEGCLISLHDHRSPIYSKSVYQPHSLFRPRTGLMSSSTNSQHFEEIETNRNKKLVQSSISKERVSKFQDEALFSKVKPNQHEYCSEEAPCAPNSEFISGLNIKPGMYILSTNIKIHDPLKETNQLRQKIQSSIKLNEGIDLKPFLISRNVYVVTPSAEIKVPKSTESSQAEERYKDDFITDHSRYSRKEKDFTTIFSIPT